MKPLVGSLRTLGFGLVAAVGAVAWQFTCAWFLQPSTSLAVYALLCCCAFPVAVAPSLRRAVLAAALCVPLAIATAVVAPDSTTAILGAALIAALGRATSYWAKPARALALEVTLFGLGLLTARFCGGTSPFGSALGVWSYCLVQSLYFLFLAPATREPAALPEDAFDVAHRRALAALEQR